MRSLRFSLPTEGPRALFLPFSISRLPYVLRFPTKPHHSQVIVIVYVHKWCVNSEPLVHSFPSSYSFNSPGTFFKVWSSKEEEMPELALKDFGTKGKPVHHVETNFEPWVSDIRVSPAFWDKAMGGDIEGSTHIQCPWHPLWALHYSFMLSSHKYWYGSCYLPALF